MKRHPALQDLSRDHHVVLVYGQRMRRALAARATRAELAGLLGEFVGFARSDLLAHFDEEDGFVQPLAMNLGSRELVEAARRVASDHAWLRGAIESLEVDLERGAPLESSVAELERRLTDHVRFEESHLFQGVQSEVPEDVLQRMWRASYGFRSKHRSPDACTVRPRDKLKRT